MFDESFIKGFEEELEKSAMDLGKLKEILKALSSRARALRTGTKPKIKSGITEGRQIEALKSRAAERILRGRFSR